MKTIEVVAAVIYDDDKFLITKRKHKLFNGLWEFPGGKIEENETHEKALIREIKEELEIDIKVNDFITTVEYQYPEFHLIMYVYKCEKIFGKINLNVHSDIRWITKEQINEFELVPADIGVFKNKNNFLL